MAKQIELYSSKTFTVYKELSFVDKSLDIEKSKIVNTSEMIRVLPTWTSKKAKIKRGTHSYDADVLTWPTVRSFIKAGTIKVISEDYEKEFTKPTKVSTKQTSKTSLESLVPEDN